MHRQTDRLCAAALVVQFWRRLEDGLASISVLIHSCKMPEESETTDLMMDESGLLVGNATDVGISDKVVPANVQDFS